MQNEVSKPADKRSSSSRMNKNLVVTHRVGSVAEQGPVGFFGRTALTSAVDKGKWWEIFFHATLVNQGSVEWNGRCPPGEAAARGLRLCSCRTCAGSRVPKGQQHGWEPMGARTSSTAAAGPIPFHFFKEISHLYCWNSDPVKVRDATPTDNKYFWDKPGVIHHARRRPWPTHCYSGCWFGHLRPPSHDFLTFPDCGRWVHASLLIKQDLMASLKAVFALVLSGTYYKECTHANTLSLPNW